MIAKVKKLIVKILPSFLLNFLYYIQRMQKRKKINKMRERGQIISVQDIIRPLKEVGVKNGDNLFVHCKMSSIGYIEGGAESVIEGLCSVINAPKEGTLLMPSFPHHQLAYEYFENNSVFDVKNTSSQMGVVSERFRTKPSVKRSLHPSHPVSAYGPKTSFF
jgi:aminoglycoside 3-N-acetyltransferase